MPAAGAKPKDESKKLGHTPVSLDWTQVPNTPYTGRRPTLPRRRATGIDERGKAVTVPLHDLTKAWWRDVSTMPHCALWSASDWRFAIETALIADGFHYGDRVAAAELRLRERVLGTTLDSRRDLRIRYVDADYRAAVVEQSPDASAAGATVTSMDARRQRLTGAP